MAMVVQRKARLECLSAAFFQVLARVCTIFELGSSTVLVVSFRIDSDCALGCAHGLEISCVAATKCAPCTVEHGREMFVVGHLWRICASSAWEGISSRILPASVMLMTCCDPCVAGCGEYISRSWCESDFGHQVPDFATDGYLLVEVRRGRG